MNKVFIGKIVNTHGVKGEFRIKSDFEKKNQVFNIGNYIIIDNTQYKILSYRIHKGYDMVTIEGFNDLDSVIPLKGKNVYFNRDSLEINELEYLYEDLIDSKVIFESNVYGKVTDYTLGLNPLLYIKNNNNDNKMIPLNDMFIDKFDKSTKTLYVSDNAKGLL